MSNVYKILLSLFVLFLIFKLGYKKAVHNDPVAPTLSSMKNKMANPPVGFFRQRTPTSRTNYILNGVPTEIAAYLSNESVTKQASVFERKWRLKGHEPVTQSYGSMKIISLYNENKKLFETAIILPDPTSGKTMVIPAKLDLSRPVVNNSFKTPLYPKSQTLLHLEANEFGGYSENVMLMSDASVPAIMNFYTSYFQQKGWQIAKMPKKMFNSWKSEVRLFTRGTDERWVSASKMAGQNQTAVFLNYNDKP